VQRNQERDIMKKLLLLMIVAAMLVPCAFAQLNPVTSTVSVNVLAEAGLTVPTNATLTSTGSLFANYTGTNTFTYYVRTSSGTGGGGSITMQVTSDFGPGGPSVASSAATGDYLTYVSTPVSPATAATTSLTASTTTATTVATFGANAHSAKGGNAGNTVNWTLINDPMYATGTYTSTVTWTISAA
jgi:hypothetical protein